jgi:metal-responsive CopG/Arc/MetJ family transcriptional regulator
MNLKLAISTTLEPELAAELDSVRPRDVPRSKVLRDLLREALAARRAKAQTPAAA